ncbi:hypothetical protein J4N42_21555 [Vibrio sp. SCSIO 43135]|uniref:Uncharacterized protein n=1 Tax=Vibrio paucivorans TaxID=2829489 RepID=A0A9X3CJ53_9VIBR|nr:MULTISPECIES: hypothetical protein [Vibrio]MCW8336464.1 hypothetical protein [Vibrio paucivorans]USD43182.1 hypothetical protein J4N42_21555 [Vibrio sp. SCSIO 43135]
MPLTLDQAAQLMNQDLEQFLLRCPLSISSAGKQKGEVRFYLYGLGDTAMGRHQGMPVKEGRLRLSTTALSTTAKAIQCIHIPVSQFEQLKPESISKVTHYDTAKFLVTTQLTGCTFAIRPGKGGGLEFLHIQPNGDFDGKKVQQAVGKEFQVSFGRGSQNDGSTYDDNSRVTVMGVRVNNLWKVYAQYQDGDGNILGVECIYQEPSSVAYV